MGSPFKGRAIEGPPNGTENDAMTYKSDFLRIMDERGFIHQGTNLDGLDQKLSSGIVSGYIGFDATAPT